MQAEPACKSPLGGQPQESTRHRYSHTKEGSNASPAPPALPAQPHRDAEQHAWTMAACLGKKPAAPENTAALCLQKSHPRHGLQQGILKLLCKKKSLQLNLQGQIPPCSSHPSCLWTGRTFMLMGISSSNG